MTKTQDQQMMPLNSKRGTCDVEPTSAVKAVGGREVHQRIKRAERRD